MSATATATLHTTAGDIRLNLFGDQAPKTVRNFTELALGSREWTNPAIEPIRITADGGSWRRPVLPMSLQCKVHRLESPEVVNGHQVVVVDSDSGFFRGS